ncbi:MAG: hypothetical protein ACR2OO_09450 [Thermomicrobiales bacterium]
MDVDLITGDDASRHADGLSGWSVEGTATMVASGADVAAALESALTSLLRAICGDGVFSLLSAGLSTPIQAEAGDLSALLVELTAALLDQLEGEVGAVCGFTMDGALRTDEGWTAWGVARLAEGVRPTVRPVEFVGTPVVVETSGGVTIEARVRRAGG